MLVGSELTNRVATERSCRLEEADLAIVADPEKLLAIDDVLDRLSREAAEVAELVKLRFLPA